MSRWKACALGVCAAEDGHEGTCDEASGWDEPMGSPEGWMALAKVMHRVAMRDPQYAFDWSEPR